MKRFLAWTLVVGLGLVFSATLAHAAKWTTIGEQVVDNPDGNVSIVVSNDSPFRLLKLQVKTNKFKIGTVKVTFKDGTGFDATIDRYLVAPGTTRELELPAAKPIEKVTFTYQTVGSRAYPPVVRLLGSQ
jgi:hypothetical protein